MRTSTQSHVNDDKDFDDHKNQQDSPFGHIAKAIIASGTGGAMLGGVFGVIGAVIGGVVGASAAWWVDTRD